MQREHLHALVRQRPFVPFRVYLTDGRAYDLRHAHLLLLGQDWLTMGFPAEDDPDPEPFFETFVSVPLGWIERSEPADEPLLLEPEGGAL